MSKDDDDYEVDRCLRTETRSDEEGTSATTEDGSILLAEEDEAEVILAAGRGRLRIAREKAEVVTTSFGSVVAETTDADGTIDEKNTTNPL